MKYFFKNKTNIILLIMLIGVLGAAGFLGYTLFAPKAVQAIDFSKLTESEITAWAQSNSISDKIEIEYEFSDEVKKDSVISQSYAEGESIKDKLKIVISSGMDPEKEVELPKLAEGTRKQDLEDWFEKNGFSNVSYEYALNDDLDKDTVISLSKEGAVRRNDEIVVTLSAGDEKNMVDVEVPDFTGKTKKEIASWASQNAITVKYYYDTSDSVASGKLISQSVKAGSVIPSGSEMTVTLSEGKGITMISLVGKTKADAASWISSNGLTATYSTDYSDKYAEGVIISQSVSSGKVVTENTSVKLTVSKGPHVYIKVPADRLGNDEETFVKYIKGLGLKVSKENTTYFSTVYKANTIFKYDDGDTFEEGDTISYALSAGAYSFNASEFNGKSESAAKSLVGNYNGRNAHITFNSPTGVETNDHAEGTLFDCSSSANGSNTTISCKIAKKKVVYVDIPDLSGKTKSEVSSWASSSKITVNFSEEYSTSVASGKTVSQSAKAGTQLAEGSSMNVVISLGEDTRVTVPNLSSYSRSQIESWASDNSINVSFSEQFSSSVAEGKVISQSVSSGTVVHKGDSMSVVISKGREIVYKYIQSADGYDYLAVDGNPSATADALRAALSDFANLTIRFENGNGLNAGRVTRVIVDGNEIESRGSYSTDSVVEIYISEK